MSRMKRGKAFLAGVLAAALLAVPAHAQENITPETSIQISSYKGTTLKAGDRSMLMPSPISGEYTAISSNSEVVDVEKVMSYWVAVAKANGTAAITMMNSSGATAAITLTVSGRVPEPSAGSDPTIDLSANMEIRQEMIRLINQVRRENGVAELAVNEALMNAAQDCSAQGFPGHNTEYECKAAMAYGYPHGFGDNYTRFAEIPCLDLESVAQKAVANWVKSPRHFAAMVDPACDTLGVGVTIQNQEACCYMFAGDPNSCHLYG